LIMWTDDIRTQPYASRLRVIAESMSYQVEPS
jgi:hypothetical protein